MEELTYKAAEAKKVTFAQTGLTRSDISFAKKDQYAILYLKRSKTNTEHTWVQIILAVTRERICPVAALRQLFIQNLCPANASLFFLQTTAFTRQGVVNILRQRIMAAGFSGSNYSSNSFQKKAAQHAANHSMLDKSI